MKNQNSAAAAATAGLEAIDYSKINYKVFSKFSLDDFLKVLDFEKLAATWNGGAAGRIDIYETRIFVNFFEKLNFLKKKTFVARDNDDRVWKFVKKENGNFRISVNFKTARISGRFAPIYETKNIPNFANVILANEKNGASSIWIDDNKNFGERAFFPKFSGKIFEMK
jgi:hypothetical protein